MLVDVAGAFDGAVCVVPEAHDLARPSKTLDDTLLRFSGDKRGSERRSFRSRKSQQQKLVNWD